VGSIQESSRFEHQADQQSRAELALIASRLARTERSMAALLDNLPATVVRFDAGLCIRFANRAYAALFGLDEAEIPGRLLEDIVGPESFADIKSYFERALAGEVVTYERFVATARVPAWYEIRIVPSGDGGCFSVAFDISARKAHELEIARREERFRALTALSSDWYWEQDAAFRFTHMEGAGVGKNGVDPATILGKVRWDIGYDEVVGQTWDAHRAQLGRHESFSGLVCLRRNPDGSLRTASQLAGEPLYDEAGTFCGYRGVGQDVTERVRAEEAAERAQRRAEHAEQVLRTAIEVLDDGFVLYDKDDRLVICNERYRELYAESRPLMIPGASFEDIIRAGAASGAYPDAVGREDEWVDERLATHRAADGRVEQRRADGRWIRIAERRTMDGGIVGFRVDITELKSALMRIQSEEELAEQLFAGAVMGPNVRVPSLRMLIRPTSMFSGDVVLCAHAPNRDLHALIGDFTGHGLSAALGALPVAEIFRSMTAKGYSIDRIALEINKKLRTLLPRGYFLAATLMRIQADIGTVEVCNCGMPALMLSLEGAVRTVGRSHNVPLGVLDEADFRPELERFSVRPGARLLCASDGFLEAVSGQGEQFGMERAMKVLGAVEGDKSAVAALERALDEHRGAKELADDATLAEFVLDEGLFAARVPAPSGSTPSEGAPALEGPGWKLVLQLDAQAVRRSNHVPAIVSFLTEVGGLSDRNRQAMLTVLTELWVNALDHGMLGLSSEIKAEPDGFERYFSERERRLAALQDGTLVISASSRANSKDGKLALRVEHSGSGFDPERVARAPVGAPYGRGMALVRSMCDSLEYDEGGRRASAVYTLGGKPDGGVPEPAT
jgi:PAS domain S-box-containing protein